MKKINLFSKVVLTIAFLFSPFIAFSDTQIAQANQIKIKKMEQHIAALEKEVKKLNKNIGANFKADRAGNYTLALNGAEIVITQQGVIQFKVGGSSIHLTQTGININSTGRIDVKSSIITDIKGSMVSINSNSNGRPAARAGDTVIGNYLSGTAQIQMGSSTVLIGN